MIALSRLKVAFKKEVVLDNIDLKVNPGEIFGITGANGSGKTVLIKTLATLFKPTSGIVEIAGFDILKNRKKVRSIIGYVPDTIGFDSQLCVEDYLAFFRSMYGKGKREEGLSLEDLFDAVGLKQKNGKLLSTLSRGEKQKVSLIRAMIHNPSVLLLDDPDVGLDWDGLVKINSLLKELSNKGTTVMISSHSVALLNSLSKRIGVIHNGQIKWIFQAGTESQKSIQTRIRELKRSDDKSCTC